MILSRCTVRLFALSAFAFFSQELMAAPDESPAKSFACPVVGDAKENIIEISCDETAGTYHVVTHTAPSERNVPVQERQKDFSILLNGQDVKERKLFSTCHLGKNLHVVTDIDLDRERNFLSTGPNQLGGKPTVHDKTFTLITSAADVSLFNETNKIAEITDVMFSYTAVSIEHNLLKSCQVWGKNVTSYEIDHLADKPLQLHSTIVGSD